jgi:hypothetical protein
MMGGKRAPTSASTVTENGLPWTFIDRKAASIDDRLHRLTAWHANPFTTLLIRAIAVAFVRQFDLIAHCNLVKKSPG